MNLQARSEPKRNSNPQHEQPCYRLLPLKLCILGMDLNDYLLLLLGFQRVGFAIEEGKRRSIDACPYFCCVFSLLFTTSFLSFFLSLCSFYLLFLTAIVSWVVLSSFYHSLSFSFFYVTSISVFTTFFHWVPPPLFCMPPSPFYSGLI